MIFQIQCLAHNQRRPDIEETKQCKQELAQRTGKSSKSPNTGIIRHWLKTVMLTMFTELKASLKYLEGS